jgi:acyl-CoA thioester hydrolase
MQEIAIEHSTAAGWPMKRYLEIGAGWVVRSHFIEYLRPAFAGELLSAHTWVPRFDERATPRRYLFVREADRQLLAQAETRWVFVDLATGRRRPLPAELTTAFEVVAEESEVRASLGVAS